MRIGVAKSDPDGILASPIATIPGDESATGKVLELIQEHAAEVVYIGLPINLKGQNTPSTHMALDFAKELRKLLPTTKSIFLLDERMSTKIASSKLKSLNISEKKSRKFIDQAAAVAILETALDFERIHHFRAGQELTTNE